MIYIRYKVCHNLTYWTNISPSAHLVLHTIMLTVLVVEWVTLALVLHGAICISVYFNMSFPAQLSAQTLETQHPHWHMKSKTAFGYYHSKALITGPAQKTKMKETENASTGLKAESYRLSSWGAAGRNEKMTRFLPARTAAVCRSECLDSCLPFVLLSKNVCISLLPPPVGCV